MSLAELHYPLQYTKMLHLSILAPMSISIQIKIMDACALCKSLDLLTFARPSIDLLDLSARLTIQYQQQQRVQVEELWYSCALNQSSRDLRDY